MSRNCVQKRQRIWIFNFVQSTLFDQQRSGKLDDKTGDFGRLRNKLQNLFRQQKKAKPLRNSTKFSTAGGSLGLAEIRYYQTYAIWTIPE